MAPCNRIATRALVEKDCAHWPADLQLRWIALFDPENPLSEKPWVRETQYQYAGVFSRYLACCTRHGLPPELSSEGLRTFIRSCAEAGNAARTISGYVWQLSHFATLMMPERYEEHAWLRQSALRIQRAADRTPKRRGAHIARSPVLALRGQELIVQARAAARQDIWATTELYRNGLWLRLGTYDPERLRALGALQWSWIDFEAGIIRFPGGVEKVPEDAERALFDTVRADFEEWRTYWARWNPDHDFVWIAKGGKPASLAALAAAMRRVTVDLPGGPFSPHAFRHGAATFLTEAAPDRAALPGLILNHRSAKVTKGYMERAKRIEASRTLVRIMAAGEEQVRRTVRAITRSTIAHAPTRRR
jgi:integrase